MNRGLFKDKERLTRMIHDYEVEGMDMIKLATKYGVNSGTIYYHLNKNGAKIRRGIRHTVNAEYFADIDTEVKAYLLGFIYADGCVTTHQSQMNLSFGLAEEDAYMVNRLRDELEYSGPVHIYVYDRPGRDCQNEHRVCVNSDRLCGHLIRHGCHPRKSFTLEWPKPDMIPSHLMHHFVRGFFDGDGWISEATNKATGRTQLIVGACGNLAFMTGLQAYLIEHAGASDAKLTIYNRIYKLTYTGNHLAKRICDHLYRDATIYLTRKRNKYLASESPVRKPFQLLAAPID